MKALKLGLALTALCFGTAAAAHAEEWPAKPIHMLVPFPAGGSADVVARILQGPLEEALKKPLIVENKAGGGGEVGAAALVKSAPDGYTIGIATTFLANNVSLQPKLQTYKPLTDLTYIGFIGKSSNILAVHPSLPIHSVKDLIDYVKANPNKVSYGHVLGSSLHLAAELFKYRTGLKDLEGIPYRGSAQTLTDLLGGQVQFVFGSFAATIPYVRSNQLRAIAVTSLKRSTVLPDVPIMNESGVSDFESGEWFGLSGPANLPPKIVARLNEVLNQALSRPEVIEKLLQSGIAAEPSTPDQFKAFIAKSIEDTRDLVQKANIKLE